MDESVTFRWSYSPEDYFEEPMHFSDPPYEVTIADGTVEARVSPDYHENAPSMAEEAHGLVRTYFLAAGAEARRSFHLCRPSLHRGRPHGTKDVTFLAGPLSLTASVGRPDIVITQANGTVVTDTKAERIQKQRQRMGLAGKHRADRPLAAILNQLNAAVGDPADVIAHLYNIRDVLQSHFRGAKKACSALRVSDSKWERLGILANVEPLREGRHPGRSVAQAHNATEEQLSEAYEITGYLIDRYLQWLEKQQAGD